MKSTPASSAARRVSRARASSGRPWTDRGMAPSPTGENLQPVRPSSRRVLVLVLGAGGRLGLLAGALPHLGRRHVVVLAAVPVGALPALAHRGFLVHPLLHGP